MSLQSRKHILEVFGLCRLVLGLAQLVGLTAAYFLTDFIIQYPDLVVRFAINENMIALIYLAIFIRIIFHIIAGIGIARIKPWVNAWLYYGWPVMILITYGLAHSFYEEWQLLGYVNKLIDIINIPKLLVYIFFIAFDLVFVTQSIKQLNMNHKTIPSLGGNMQLKNIIFISLVAIFAFIVIMFVAQPMREGFQQGFYYGHGNKHDPKGKLQQVLQPSEKVSSVNKKSILEVNKKKEGLAPQAEITSELIVKDEKIDQESQVVEDEKKTIVPKGIPFKKYIGFVAGIFILAGLFCQFIDRKNGGSKLVSIASFILLSVGFLCWTMYGFYFNLQPVIFSFLVAGLVCCAKCVQLLLNDS